MVAITPLIPRMTASEYHRLGEAGDLEPFSQLIDGVIVVSSPMFRHQRAVGLLHARLLAWTEGGGHGVASLTLDLTVDEHNVYAPDVLWVADRSRVTLDSLFQGIPDLAVEVRSPSTWRYDVGIKRRRYEENGLPELWLVDTKKQVVRVLRRTEPAATSYDTELELVGDDVLRSPQLPGFALALPELFPD